MGRSQVLDPGLAGLVLKVVQGRGCDAEGQGQAERPRSRIQAERRIRDERSTIQAQ